MDTLLMHEDGKHLAALAQVLKNNAMPQETINMVLAARCGLPMQKVDSKSPYFLWVDEEIEANSSITAGNIAPEKETAVERLRRVRAQLLSNVEGMDWSLVLDILVSASNEVAAPHGYMVIASLRPLTPVQQNV